MTKELLFDIFLICIGIGLCADASGSLMEGVATRHGVISQNGFLLELSAGFFIAMYGVYQYQKDLSNPDWEE